MASLDYAVNRSYSSGQGRFTTVDPIGMGASSLGNPQSNNLYAYVENNPIDFVDPSGLFKLAPKPQEPDYGALLSLIFGNRPRYVEQPVIDEPGGGGGGGGVTGGDDDLAKKYNTPPCDVSKYDQLTDAQKKLITGDAYNNLSQLQKAVFVNITGALTKAGANLTGLNLSEVENDRLIFKPDSTNDLQKSIKAGEKANPKTFNEVGIFAKFGHKGMKDYLVRENVAENALQVGFGKAGIFADIDLWNPQKEFGKHQSEIKYNGKNKTVTPHFYLAKVFGNCK